MQIPGAISRQLMLSLALDGRVNLVVGAIFLWRMNLMRVFPICLLTSLSF
jgi:hypothetical protein